MNTTGQTDANEIERLVHEIDEAELFVQKLHAYIAAIRDALTAGDTGRALSMCNLALNDIDSATDVVAPSTQHAKRVDLDADPPAAGGGRP